MATKHFSHDHPLTQWHMKDKDEELKCYGCDIPVEGPVYGCKDCKFHLHKSCAELPEEFQHPYHRDHPLVLRVAWREHFCHFCCSPICGFNLCCDDCDFYLDARCASVYSNQQFAARIWEDGGHVFCLKKTEPKTMYPCDACNNFDDDTYLYQCALPACPRIIHFRCAPFPLPESIKHKRHLHPLNLTPSYVEDDSGEYYCDSCEKYRNENHPVYRCIPCDYVAHVSCAIFEELPSIITAYEDGAQSRGISTNDVTLGNLNTKIQEIHWEEDELKHQLQQMTEKIKKLEDIRALYVSYKMFD